MKTTFARSILLLITTTAGVKTFAQGAPSVSLPLPGPPAIGPFVLVEGTNRWRYRQSVNLDGTGWQLPGYDDTNWPSGPALLAFENNPAIVPLVRTILQDPRRTTPPGAATYFRTHFNWPGAPGAAALIFSNRVDDGCVVYLNGTELYRVRMAGPDAYTALAQGTPPPNGDAETWEVTTVVSAPSLVPGDNVLAVSVHQASTNGTDILWGSVVMGIMGIVPPPIAVTLPPTNVAPQSALLLGTVQPNGFTTSYYFEYGLTNGPGQCTPTNELPARTNVMLAAAAVFNLAPSSVYWVRLWAQNFGGQTNGQTLLFPTPTDCVPLLVRGPYLQSGTPTSMTVCWRTTCPSASQVRAGNTGLATRVVYDPAPVTDHFVTLTGLMPDARYYYAVGDGVTEDARPEFYFNTSPTGGKPTRIWVIGDAGTAPMGLRANQEAVRNAYTTFTGSRGTDVWLMLGDNAYWSGLDEEYQQAVFDVYPELLRNVVLWPTIGNHDTGLAAPYLNIFHLPTGGEAGGVASGTERCYAFDYGNIHFVCLDSQTSSRSPSGWMHTWLEADLAANTKDWLIAFWHHPPYSKGSHDSDNPSSEYQLIEMRQNFLPLLEAHGVDLVLCGHSHSYERSFLLDGHYGFSASLTELMKKDGGDGLEGGTGAYRKPLVGPGANQGAVYVVAGSSGQVSPGTLDHPAMFISLMELGSLVLDINGQRLDAQFLGATGATRDHFTILKGLGPAPLRLSLPEWVADSPLAKVKLSFKTISGRSYRLVRTTSLTAPQWQPVGPPIVATGATTFWEGPADTNAPAGFYRVEDISQ